MSNILEHRRYKELDAKQKTVFKKTNDLLVGLSYKQSEDVLYALLDIVKSNAIIKKQVV